MARKKLRFSMFMFQSYSIVLKSFIAIIFNNHEINIKNRVILNMSRKF